MHCRATSVNMCERALLSPLGYSLKIALCLSNFCQDVVVVRGLVCGCCCLSGQSILLDAFLSAYNGLFSSVRLCG